MKRNLLILFFVGIFLFILTINLSTLGYSKNFLYQASSSSSGCSTTQVFACGNCNKCTSINQATCMCTPSGCETQCNSPPPPSSTSTTSGTTSSPGGCSAAQIAACGNCTKCTSINQATFRCTPSGCDNSCASSASLTGTCDPNTLNCGCFACKSVNTSTCMCAPPGCQEECPETATPTTSSSGTCAVTIKNCNCFVCTSINTKTCMCDPPGCERLCIQTGGTSGGNVPFCLVDQITCPRGTPFCTSAPFGQPVCKEVFAGNGLQPGCSIGTSFFPEQALCEGDTINNTSGGPMLDLLSYVIINGPGAGIKLSIEKNAGLSFVQSINSVVEAEGIISLPDKHCPGSTPHYDGRLFGKRNPNLLMCGWGHIILFSEAEEKTQLISALIMKAYTIKQAISQDSPDFTVITESATDLINGIEDFQDKIRLANGASIKKEKAALIISKIQVALNDCKTARNILKRLQKTNTSGSPNKKSIKSTNSNLDSSIKAIQEALKLTLKVKR